MAKTIAEVRESMRPHRVRIEAFAVSLLALIAFVTLGLRAHRAAQPARTELAKLTVASSEVAAFRASFQPSSPEQEMRVGQLSESLAVAVSRDFRVTLAQQIAARAEALGLSHVRVKFAPLDSAAAPVRPEIEGTAVSVADYSLSVECTGGFAAVLTLVNRLPASVALQRLIAGNGKDATQFRLTLAVFEAANTNAPAVGGGGTPTMGDPVHRWLALLAAVVVVVALAGWRALSGAGANAPVLGAAAPGTNPQLTQLIPFSKPLADSLRPPPLPADTIVLPRDPFAMVPLGEVAQARPEAGIEPPRPRESDDTRWQVTATLMAGAFRAAIINDVVVHVGESVPGGVTLTSVERDHVVLTDPKGTAHTVAVKEGER